MNGIPADNITVNENGKLCFAGRDVTLLGKKYGTPLWLLDEERLRENCRKYTSAVKKCMKKGSMVLYASKALCMKGLYPILLEEGMGADVVSGGEIATALAAGFPADRLYFHGNNKSAEELDYALDKGIGAVIVDNGYELGLLDAAAGKKGKKQDVLLRLTPGIDPHTFNAVDTGRIDCQFGMPVETGQARDFVIEALKCNNLTLKGYHFHIGSQIFDSTPFIDALKIMARFSAEIRQAAGYEPSVLDIGGGFGVRYKEEDPLMDIPGGIRAIQGALEEIWAEAGLELPAVMLEPGRSIVADAVMTVYTAGPVKEINGYRKYVIVDGGMSDNPRYALYRSKYTVLNASRMDESEMVEISVSGRCCEPGALIQEYVKIPLPHPGDTIAVCTTGAYNYSMASNYNRLPKPAMVMLMSGGGDRLIIRRQTWEEMAECELI